MQFIDLKAQYRQIKEMIDQRISQVLEHGQFLNGKEIRELELRLAEYVNVKHCFGVSSGTDALLIALLALDVGRGDEVITTPFSFIATASMVKLLGAKPVFIDINPLTYNIDPAQLEQAITPRTKAILPVNLYGQCAEYDEILAIAQQHKLAVIEDAAQSFGASYKGRKSGSLGTISCTSFYPSKPLACYGDGGACFTNNEELAAKIRQIRNHGQDRSYNHMRLGINGRLDTLQAAILLAKFEVFPAELQLRAKVAQKYNNLLTGKVITPVILPYNESALAQYTIQVDNREQVIQTLAEQGIPTAVHYPLAIHQQPLFASLCEEKNCTFPQAEAAAKRVLSLPFHPYLKDEEISKIAEAILEIIAVTVVAH
jgi:UDP-2-acetamido-2-deoxy-ribo-hexuluronate aminotransferase